MAIDALRRAALAAALCGMAGAAAAGEAIVRYDADGSVRLYTTSPEAPAGGVLAQYPGHDGKARCCKALAMAAGAAEAAPPTVSDPLGSNTVWVHRAKPVRLPARAAPFVGAAVYGRDAPRLQQRTPAEQRRVMAGDAATVIACATGEGFHVMTAKRGEATGHLYLSFDYSVEPTCSNEQMKLLTKQ